MVESNVWKHHQWNFNSCRRLGVKSQLTSELNVIPEALHYSVIVIFQGVGIWHNTYSQMDKQWLVSEYLWHGQGNRYVVLLTWAESKEIAMNSPVFIICRCCDATLPYTFTISSRERSVGNCKLRVFSSCCSALGIPSSNMTLAFPSLHSPCSCNGYSDACSYHCARWRHLSHNTRTCRSMPGWYTCMLSLGAIV